MGDCWKNGVLYGLRWANFEPKFQWAPNVFWVGSEEVKCSLPHGKSHSEDGTSKPFMSEWEVDVVFGFYINFLDKIHLNFFNKNYCGNLI